MAKDSWERLMDTMEEVGRIIGPGEVNHVINMIPAKGTGQANDLSARISLGNRGLFRRRDETQRRRTIRAYALLLILLEGVDEQTLATRFANVSGTTRGGIQRFAGILWDEYNKPSDTTTLRRELQAFKTNPVQFARRYSIHPSGHIDPQGDDYSLVHMPRPLIQKMVLCPKRGATGGAFELQKAPMSRQAYGEDMYYLPWSSARAVKTSLPAHGGPDLFVTAALSGCSVIAEGQATAPTVYHMGIMGEIWPQMDHTVPQQAPPLGSWPEQSHPRMAGAVLGVF